MKKVPRNGRDPAQPVTVLMICFLVSDLGREPNNGYLRTIVLTNGTVIMTNHLSLLETSDRAVNIGSGTIVCDS